MYELFIHNESITVFNTLNEADSYIYYNCAADNTKFYLQDVNTGEIVRHN